MDAPVVGEVVEFPCGAQAIVKEVLNHPRSGNRTVHVVLVADTGIYAVREDGTAGETMDAVWIAFNSRAVDKLIEFLQRVKDGRSVEQPS